MLSIRVFGEDITKPHTATLKGLGPKPTPTEQESVDVVENHLEGEEEASNNL